jgi:DNA-binding SARP family transcriptional activator
MAAVSSEESSAAPVVVVNEGAAVWVCLLGSFRLLSCGHVLPVRTGGKTQALLAQLGLAGLRGMSRDRLIAAVWPNSEPILAAQALNSVLRGLRTLLYDALGGAEPVVPCAGQYRLNEEAGLAVDVERFRELVAEGERLHRNSQVGAAAAAYDLALTMYRGDLTPVAGRTSHVALERERLRASYLRVLLRLADDAFGAGGFDECLQHALTLLAHDPCREDAHRLVMRCHMRLGERSQAMHHYQTVREILRVELDAEPEPATTALFEQIRLTPGCV